MINYNETTYKYTYFLTKRIVDYLVTIFASIFLLPLSLLIYILILIDSPGKPIYKQKRVGINGIIFDMYKFRTMYENVDEKLHKEHISAYASGDLNISNGVKIHDDPRVTRVGKFLRRTSLDEIPQFINVLNGNMSIVGPRPLPIYEVDYFKQWHSERLSVLPGITGYWQVYGRGLVSFDDQLRLDIHYIKHKSTRLDLKLLFLTMFTVLGSRGAS